MRKPTSPKIVVGPNDSMPDILTRLRSATGGPAALAIPASSSLLLTASEFRALKAAAEQARISLTVETDDRLRRQLATMFKIPVIDLLPGAVITLEDTPPPRETVPPTTPDPVAKSYQVMPEVPKLALPPAVEVTPKWEPPKADEAESESSDRTPIPEAKSERSFHFPLKAFSIALMSLLIMIVIGVGLAYFFQSATLTLTVKREQISTDLTYAVVSPGATEPEGGIFAISAQPVTLKVPYAKTIPVTGVIREPDQIASGRISLRNPTDGPIELTAGTTFNDRNGVEFVVDTTVSVPAADEATGPGRADAGVRAAVGGEEANRDIGLLSGKLETGLFYSNRDQAVAGGTDKKTFVVDQADIDRLIADATDEIPALAISSPLADGQTVLPGTLMAGELTYSIDHEAGDQAESVSIAAEMVVTGMAFLPSDAATQASIQIQNDLAAKTPAGFELEPSSTVINAPVLINDSGESGLYRITATASARTVIDEARRDQIANEIAGMSEDEAEAYLAQLDFVERFDISSSPGFLPKRIPSNANNIEVETT